MEPKDSNKEKVVNLTDVRNERGEEKRRKNERILFKNILGAYCVIEGEGLRAIDLVDVSAAGLSFQLPNNSKNLEGLEEGKEFMFRLYLTEETFMPVVVRIANKRKCLEDGEVYVRFGCIVDTELKSYEMFKKFADFLSYYAENCKTDKDNMKLFFF